MNGSECPPWCDYFTLVEALIVVALWWLVYGIGRLWLALVRLADTYYRNPKRRR